MRTAIGTDTEYQSLVKQKALNFESTERLSFASIFLGQECEFVQITKHFFLTNRLIYRCVKGRL
jgi:hypothetical protein